MVQGALDEAVQKAEVNVHVDVFARRVHGQNVCQTFRMLQKGFDLQTSVESRSHRDIVRRISLTPHRTRHAHTLASVARRWRPSASSLR